MADKVQKVIYRILVDTKQLAAGVAAARAELAALKKADDDLNKAQTTKQDTHARRLAAHQTALGKLTKAYADHDAARAKAVVEQGKALDGLVQKHTKALSGHLKALRDHHTAIAELCRAQQECSDSNLARMAAQSQRLEKLTEDHRRHSNSVVADNDRQFNSVVDLNNEYQAYADDQIEAIGEQRRALGRLTDSYRDHSKTQAESIRAQRESLDGLAAAQRDHAAERRKDLDAEHTRLSELSELQLANAEDQNRFIREQRAEVNRLVEAHQEYQKSVRETRESLGDGVQAGGADDDAGRLQSLRDQVVQLNELRDAYKGHAKESSKAAKAGKTEHDSVTSSIRAQIGELAKLNKAYNDHAAVLDKNAASVDKHGAGRDKQTDAEIARIEKQISAFTKLTDTYNAHRDQVKALDEDYKSSHNTRLQQFKDQIADIQTVSKAFHAEEKKVAEAHNNELKKIGQNYQNIGSQAATAHNKLNQQVHGKAASGDSQSVSSNKGAGGKTHNYHPQLAIIISELQKISKAAQTGGFGDGAANSKKGTEKGEGESPTKKVAEQAAAEKVVKQSPAEKAAEKIRQDEESERRRRLDRGAAVRAQNALRDSPDQVAQRVLDVQEQQRRNRDHEEALRTDAAEVAARADRENRAKFPRPTDPQAERTSRRYNKSQEKDALANAREEQAALDKAEAERKLVQDNLDRLDAKRTTDRTARRLAESQARIARQKVRTERLAAAEKDAHHKEALAENKTFDETTRLQKRFEAQDARREKIASDDQAKVDKSKPLTKAEQKEREDRKRRTQEVADQQAANRANEAANPRKPIPYSKQNDREAAGAADRQAKDEADRQLVQSFIDARETQAAAERERVKNARTDKRKNRANTRHKQWQDKRTADAETLAYAENELRDAQTEAREINDEINRQARIDRARQKSIEADKRQPKSVIDQRRRDRRKNAKDRTRKPVDIPELEDPAGDLNLQDIDERAAGFAEQRRREADKYERSYQQRRAQLLKTLRDPQSSGNERARAQQRLAALEQQRTDFFRNQLTDITRQGSNEARARANQRVADRYELDYLHKREALFNRRHDVRTDPREFENLDRRLADLDRQRSVFYRNLFRADVRSDRASTLAERQRADADAYELNYKRERATLLGQRTRGRSPADLAAIDQRLRDLDDARAKFYADQARELDDSDTRDLGDEARDRAEQAPAGPDAETVRKRAEKRANKKARKDAARDKAADEAEQKAYNKAADQNFGPVSDNAAERRVQQRVAKSRAASAARARIEAEARVKALDAEDNERQRILDEAAKRYASHPRGHVVQAAADRFRAEAERRARERDIPAESARRAEEAANRQVDRTRPRGGGSELSRPGGSGGRSREAIVGDEANRRRSVAVTSEAATAERVLDNARERTAAASARALAAESALAARRSRTLDLFSRGTIGRAFRRLSDPKIALPENIAKRAEERNLKALERVEREKRLQDRREQHDKSYLDKFERQINALGRTQAGRGGEQNVRDPRTGREYRRYAPQAAFSNVDTAAYRNDPNKTLAENNRLRHEHLELQRKAILQQADEEQGNDRLSRSQRRVVEQLRGSNIERSRDRDVRRRRAVGEPDLNRDQDRSFGRRALDHFENLGDKAESAGRRMSYLSRIVLLVSTVLVLLIPVIAAATAVLGALIATIVIAVVAIGAVAVPAIAVIKDLAKALQELDKTGGPVKEKYEAIAGVFLRLKAAYETLRQATEGPILEAATAALEVISDIIDQLIPLATRIAQAFTAAFEEIDDKVNGDGFKEFLGYVAAIGPRVITGLARGIVDLVAGFGSLAKSFGPFIEWFIKGFEKMGRSFNEWTAGFATSKQFQDFMAYAMQAGPEVVDTFQALLSLAVDLGAAFAPIAHAVFTVVRALAALIDFLPTSALTGLIIVVLVLIPGLRLLFGVVGFLSSGFNALRNTLLLLLPAFNANAAAMSRQQLALTATRAAALATAVAFGLLALAMIGIGVLVYVWQKQEEAQNKARAATERHLQAVSALADEIRRTGEVSPETRQEAYKKAQSTALEFDSPATTADRFTQSTLAKEAKTAHIAAPTLAKGLTGDQSSRDEVNKKFDERIAKLDDDYGKALADVNTAPEDIDALEAQGNAARAAKKAFNDLAPTAEDLAGTMADLDKITSDAASGMTEQEKTAARLAAGLEKLTNKTDRLKQIEEALAAQRASQDADEELSDATRADQRLRGTPGDPKDIGDVAEANYQAQKKVEEAERKVIDVQRKATDVQKALTEAREAAARKVEDYVRKLRDIPLTEEQASISEARAQENLIKVLNDPTTSLLDRRQALLDFQNAQNSRRDLTEDNEQTKIDADKAFKEGVDLDPAVLQGVRDLEQAKRDETDAQHDLNIAIRDRKRVEEDGKEALEDSERGLGRLRDKAAEAHKNMEQLNTAFQLTPQLMDQIRDSYGELDARLSKALSTTPIDDYNARLLLMLKYERAKQLIADDPKLTVDQALKKAIGELDGSGASNVGPKLPGKGLGQRPDSTLGGVNTGGPAEGAVRGKGTIISDSIPAMLSVGEHVWTAAETMAVGGHEVMENLRQLVKSGKFSKEDVAKFTYGAKMQLASGGDADRAPRVGRYVTGGRVRGLDPLKKAMQIVDSPASVFYQDAANRAGGIAPQTIRAQDPSSRYTVDDKIYRENAAQSMTAALNASVTTPGSSYRTAWQRTTGMNVSGSSGGLSVGAITINNPVREEAGTSMYRALRKIALEYES